MDVLARLKKKPFFIARPAASIIMPVTSRRSCHSPNYCILPLPREGSQTKSHVLRERSAIDGEVAENIAV